LQSGGSKPDRQKASVDNPAPLTPPRAPSPSSPDYGDDGIGSKKRKHWFSRRSTNLTEEGKGSTWTFLKGRRRSEGDEGAVDDDDDDDNEPLDHVRDRSFVVVRDRVPNAPGFSAPGNSSGARTVPSAWKSRAVAVGSDPPPAA